ncbi:unnamed protein product [Adineta ricciae]|uniref:Uncharacterized protein n=1 Tax=Adineta ricciae TaxID=249248 RepID=A0A814Q4U4_ADIRI|nr:unnamed protein product [Adineta ricciae]CAF1318897.1 unnamed protein product [Adineta ricciae]
MAAISSLAASLDGGGGALNASGTGGIEMAKALSSMQIRNEQFRQLYEELKKEYASLSEAYADCQQTLEKSTEENRQMQEKFKNLLDKLQIDNRKKQAQIEEMKTQLLDNSKIDQIRDRLSSEVEGPYKLALSQLGSQLEQTKAELTKVRFELNARIKEHASELSQKDQIAEEFQLKTEKELGALRKERDLLQQHIRQEHQKDSTIEQNRARELTQLKAKVEQLNQELSEAREVKLHAEQIAAAAQRELLKERSLSKTNSSLIENERDSLKQQLTSTHQELTSVSEQLTTVNRQLHERELRIAQINSDYENLQHRYKLEVANHKIELAKVQRDQLEQQEQLKTHVQELEEKIASLTSDKAKLQLTIQEKEHNLLTNVQAAREDEWKKISEITNEKLNFEAELNILRKSNDDRQKQFEIERDRLYEQIRSLEKVRDDLTKENSHLNSTVKQTNDYQNELEREQEKTRELYKKCIKLETQLSSTNGIEQELTDMNLKLKNELNHLMNEYHANKQEVQQMNNQCTTTIENARRAFFNDRKEMEMKIEQLVEQLKKYKKRINELQKEKKDYRSRYQNFSQKLVEKSQLIEAKLNEIKQKEQSLQNVVSLQTHNQVKRQLAQLLKKHAQFQTVLDTNNTTVINDSTALPSEDKYDLNSMLTRLDRLSYEQNHQLKDFIPMKESSLILSNHHETTTTSSPDKRRTIQFEEDTK